MGQVDAHGPPFGIDHPAHQDARNTCKRPVQPGGTLPPSGLRDLRSVAQDASHLMANACRFFKASGTEVPLENSVPLGTEE